jgi:thiamine biosynthesis protein ThiS
MSAIWINGEEWKNINASTVEELMGDLDISYVTLVEYNREVLHCVEWSTTPIRSGDRAELLHLTTGG